MKMIVMHQVFHKLIKMNNHQIGIMRLRVNHHQKIQMKVQIKRVIVKSRHHKTKMKKINIQIDLNTIQMKVKLITKR